MSKTARTEDDLESVFRDAARYRWLRAYEIDSYLACGSLEKLDADIDLQIEKEQRPCRCGPDGCADSSCPARKP